MTFGLSGAALAGIAIGGSTLVSGYMGAKAAGDAADAQTAASQAGIGEQQRQFDEIKKLLAPFVEAGTGAIDGLDPYMQAGIPALQQQMDLSGANGPEAQQRAISGIESSPMFSALTRQGEEAILQNASATGGLRGGNTQAALAQFRPNMLNDMISQQYTRLGGLTQLGQLTTQNVAQLGQGAATGQASAGLATGANIAGLYGDIGSARAGEALAEGKAWGSIPNALGSAFGMYTGLGGGL